MSNKISTRSYYIKRLRDCGYLIDKISSVEYADNDSRKWSAIIDNGGMSIFVTCYKNSTLHLYDGGRYINTNLKLDTDSVEVVIELLHERGLIHKHYSYGKRPIRTVEE